MFNAIEVIFKQCGKTLQKAYKSKKNVRKVKSVDMKKWLEQIRQEARSKWPVSILHRESKKTRHQTLAHNFTNYYPIFKTFSLADSVVNLQKIHV